MGSTEAGPRQDGPSLGPVARQALAAAVEPPVDGAVERERTRQQYRLAAILFIGGGVGAFIPDLLHRPEHPPTIFLLPLLAIVSGIVTWLLAGRLERKWMHLIAVVATLEVALTAGLADRSFQIYLTFVVIYAAYVFSDRRAIAAHVLFNIAIVFAPLVYDPEDARVVLIDALVLTPTLLLAAGTVAFLRERLAESEARYRELSERDPLTGIGNYRMLGERVPRELRRAARYEYPVAVLILDLDGFKLVNDTLGHQQGDVVLREVATSLEAEIRGHDIVVRQGGDEFAVVAPRTGFEEAALLADRLRAAVARIAPAGGSLGVTIGSACFPAEAQTMEGLLAVADDRLRALKAERSEPAPRRADRARD